MPYKITNVFIIIFLVGCATPPEVKQLSVKQNQYFDVAIAAVALQSQALVLATDKLVAQAKSRIDALEQQSSKELEDLMKTGAQSESDAKQISQRIAKTASEAEQSRAKLDRDLESIKNKTLELGLFLEKMKEINITLDAYVQSKKAGEAIVKDIMKHPTVNALLEDVNNLTPKIQSSLNDVNSLLSGIN
jgi:DNA repair exonuclease SbcCD ATPase subunit